MSTERGAVHLILGVQLEANSVPVAAAEGRALVNGIGRGSIAGLELGNEPELYGSFNWDGSGHPGRAHGYDFNRFASDSSRVARALPHDVPLAGPATGVPKWFAQLRSFLIAEPRVRVATLHRYPLQVCGVAPDGPLYPTIPNLLSENSSQVLADSVAPYVPVAHARRVALRIDEMNTISCGSMRPIGQSFAAALWAIDALFQMARVGVDGVNIHTYPNAPYELFKFTHTRGVWRATVEPEYYGLLMFAQAAPPGARLLRLATTRSGLLRSWATRARDGTIRVVVINAGAGQRTVLVRMAASLGPGTLERLTAPSVEANRGVRLGGRTFGSHTTTGVLSAPRTSSITPSGRSYVFAIPGTSAALLTLSPSG